MVTTDNGYPEIKIDNSHVELSGSEETLTPLELIYTKVAIEFNFNKVYEEAYKRCRENNVCDILLGSLPELLNQLTDESTTVRDQIVFTADEMEEALDGLKEGMHRKLFLFLSQTLEVL